MTREELKGALGRCVDIYTWIRLGPGRDPQKVLLHRSSITNRVEKLRRSER